MEIIQAISDFLTSLGPAVFLPIVLTVIGLIFGLKFSKAIVSGLTLGAGFILLNLILGHFVGLLTDPVNMLIERWGISKSYVDLGWGVGSAIAFTTTIGAVIIPVAILVNVVMLALNWTKTLNVDIWNFWNFAFTGSICYIVSGNFAIGIVASIIHAIFSLKMGDRTAKRVQEHFNLPGIAISHPFALTTVPIIEGMNKLLDRIPGVKDIQWTEDVIKEKLGVFGNPLILGSILGLLLGLLAGYHTDIPALLTMAVSTGAVMIMIPKAVGFFMEAFAPISEAAQTFMQKRFNDREVYIGMDSAILLGRPVTLSASIVLIPIVLVLAMILPGNQVLPFGDLASLAYFIALVPAFSKDNLFRSIIIGAVILTVVMYVLTGFGDIFTVLGTETGYAIPEGATGFTSLSAGNWVSYILFLIARLFGRA